MIDLSALNESQRQAVEWGEGPLLVLAGPGSGKTKVLTLRIARLVEASPDERFSILGVTFTTKAATEMRERVEKLVPNARDRVRISTFHGFARDLLEVHGSHLGLRPDFTILTQEPDRVAVLESVLRDLERKGQPCEAGDTRLLPLIDRIFAQCVAEEEIPEVFADRDLGRKVQGLFGAYTARLIRENRVDFPSLLYFAIRLLDRKPRIAAQMRVVYQHVCVDEFQDTNLAQYILLCKVVGAPPANLFVVADDDQIIFEWNGASPERLRELKTDYSMPVIQLPANYRCPPEVIRLANALIRHQHDRFAGKEDLIAVRESDGQERVRKLPSFGDSDEELAWIAEDIQSRGRAEAGRCVVLGRATRLLNQAVEALTGHGVPAVLMVRKDEFASTPMRWVHSMLRLANAPADREALHRVCRTFHQMEGVLVEPGAVMAEAAAGDGDALRVWTAGVLQRQELEPETRAFIQAAQDGLGERRDYAGFIASAEAWIKFLRGRQTGLLSDGFDEFDEEWSVFGQLVSDARHEHGVGMSLHALLQSLDLVSKTPPPPPGAVRCMTVHASKGLEFPHVYLFGLAEGIFPSFQAVKAANNDPRCSEMQEERRNCFVAITRTCESLTLTHSDRYFGYYKTPSRFLREMGLLTGGEA